MNLIESYQSNRIADRLHAVVQFLLVFLILAAINTIANVENLAAAGDLLNPNLYKTATDERHFKIVQARKRTRSEVPTRSKKSTKAGGSQDSG